MFDVVRGDPGLAETQLLQLRAAVTDQAEVVLADARTRAQRHLAHRGRQQAEAVTRDARGDQLEDPQICQVPGGVHRGGGGQVPVRVHRGVLGTYPSGCSGAALITMQQGEGC